MIEQRKSVAERIQEAAMAIAALFQATPEPAQPERSHPAAALDPDIRRWFEVPEGAQLERGEEESDSEWARR